MRAAALGWLICLATFVHGCGSPPPPRVLVPSAAAPSAASRTAPPSDGGSTPAIAGDNSKRADPALQERLNALATGIETKQILHVEILTIPHSFAADSAVTPAELEGGYVFKLVLRGVGLVMLRTSLARAIRSVVLRRCENNCDADFRSAIIFYGPRETRLDAIYFGTGGRSELMGGTKVFLEGTLLSWMRECFGRRLK